MADIFEKLLKHYGNIGQHRERAHGYFTFPKLEGDISSRMIFRGKEMIVWSLNNYLGLANHPEVERLTPMQPKSLDWHCQWAPA
jgi:glycine C-acetyltransferase